MNIRFTPVLFQALRDDANDRGWSIPRLVVHLLMNVYKLPQE